MISLALGLRHYEKRSYGKSYKPLNLRSRAMHIWHLSRVPEEDVFINFVWYEKMHSIHLSNALTIKYLLHNLSSKICWVDSF